ncbi:polysaccharide deacetylase family protein [Methylobacterium pseudosasicola]|uniref:Chitooligosaccharide deacetylase n=1 Tax=Methylobacterium pseudosasicola TaxID=582667 RepID=A0A1I4HGE0_9HYPH|nr:polysaccharide deacetylase family protein [Methylobacterium pseudosasicola]SFL40807.1 Polysaccharide deacetylase [Methylobacterium pseudosasicola]
MIEAVAAPEAQAPTVLYRAKQMARAVGLTRGRVAAARMACERHALAVGGRPRLRAGGRVLCYHSVGQRALGVNDVKPARFARQIALALDLGYRFVPASRIAETGGTANELAITFDDGHRSVLTAAAPILKAHGVPWSLFVVSGWCETIGSDRSASLLTWREIAELAADGVEIGSHSVTHPDFGRLGEAETIEELVASRAMIERRLGFTPTSFAIPLGQSMNWTSFAQKAARAAGYRTLYAQAEETRPAGTVPRTFVTAFDHDLIFQALLRGHFDAWEEWV